MVSYYPVTSKKCFFYFQYLSRWTVFCFMCLHIDIYLHTSCYLFIMYCSRQRTYQRNFRRPVHIRLATHQTMKHGQLGQQYINISPNTNLVFLYAKMQARVVITATSTNPNWYSMMTAAALFVHSAHVTSNCLVNNLPLTFDACALNLATLTTKMAGWSV